MLAQSIGLATLVCTLASLGFFVLGGTPLLILAHDVHMDGKFIRQFFHHCYRIVTVFSGASALAYALAGRPALALPLGGVCGLALFMHRRLVPRMDTLRPLIVSGDIAAIRRFRQLHAGGLGLNLAQMVAMVVGLMHFKL